MCVLSGIAGFPAGSASATGAPPIGSYLWFPDRDRVPTDGDCKALVAEVNPSTQKADDWLWGRAPEGSPDVLEFYLIVSADRIDPTYSAEGDYDYGSVTWTDSSQGVTRFLLKPDEHPDIELEGSIVTASGSSVVRFTLDGVPTDGGVATRNAYFCSFEEGVRT
jgi:hypothetical protein